MIRSATVPLLLDNIQKTLRTTPGTDAIRNGTIENRLLCLQYPSTMIVRRNGLAITYIRHTQRSYVERQASTSMLLAYVDIRPVRTATS